MYISKICFIYIKFNNSHLACKSNVDSAIEVIPSRSPYIICFTKNYFFYPSAPLPSSDFIYFTIGIPGLVLTGSAPVNLCLCNVITYKYITIQTIYINLYQNKLYARNVAGRIRRRIFQPSRRRCHYGLLVDPTPRRQSHPLHR